MSTRGNHHDRSARLTHIRTVVHAAAVLALGILTLAAPASAGINQRLHPLMGNPVLGNSAEIFTAWPTLTAGLDSARIIDFSSADPPDVLVPKAASALTGAAPTPTMFQMLDAATGDFDGDGRDDVVAAYSGGLGDPPYYADVKLVVPQIRAATLDWVNATVTPHGTVRIPGYALRSQAGFRLAAGNFVPEPVGKADRQEFAYVSRVAHVNQQYAGVRKDDDRFGKSVEAIGDLDGDGVTDLAVGAIGTDDGSSPDKGAVSILFLNRDGTVKSSRKIASGAAGMGTLGAGDRFGSGIATLGDLDGDSVTDLAVGAPGTDEGSSYDRGAVWILFLKRDGTVKSYKKIASGVEGMAVLGGDDRFGASVEAIGDIDSEGHTDLAVGAIGTDYGSSYDQGAVWILRLDSLGTVKGYQKIAFGSGGFTGVLDAYDVFGTGIASVGYCDGDTIPDIAVGAPGNEEPGGGIDRGAVWILFLNANGTVKSSHQKIASGVGGFGALADVDWFGWSVEAIGDLDENGATDLAVGAIGNDEGGSQQQGAVWIVRLNPPGSPSTVYNYWKIASNIGGFTGTLSPEDHFGEGVANLGDLNEDGYFDLAVGEINDDDGGTDRGAAWILFLDPDNPETVLSHKKLSGEDGGGLLTLELMVVDSLSRVPQTLATAVSEYQGDGLRMSATFDVVAGDFNGDGIDEIALGGVRRVPADTTKMELFLAVYAYEDGALVRKAFSTYDPRDVSTWDNGEGWSRERIALATGMFNETMAEQLVFGNTLRLGHWDEYFYLLCGGTAYRFDREIWAYAPILTIETSSPTWQISGWNPAQVAYRGNRLIDNECGGYNCGGCDVTRWYSPSLGVAVGDLTNDGKAEVVITTTDSLKVYRAHNNALVPQVSMPREARFNESVRHAVQIADLDAGPDTQDGWKPEIVLQDWGGAGTTTRLRVIRPDTTVGFVTGLTTLCSREFPSMGWREGEVAFVCGDFDGDAVHLGGPDLHRGIAVERPLVVLNVPPVHFDVLDQPYDLAGCYDSQQYDCASFHSLYTNTGAETQTISSETKSDWAVSAGLDFEFSFLGPKVKASFSATYGENFSHSQEGSNTVTVTETTPTEADGLDRILTQTAVYDFWEYPVYVHGNSEPCGHVAIAVVDTVHTPIWSAYDPLWPGGLPIKHEPGNILSYPAWSPQNDPNIRQFWESHQWEVAGPGGAFTPAYQWEINWEKIDTYGWSSDWKSGVEWDVNAGGISTKGHYSGDSLQTQRTIVKEGIDIQASLGTLLSNPPRTRYTVQAYAYIAKSGALVLDYAVLNLKGSPGDPSWWDAKYGNEPDLALVLPRLRNEDKFGIEPLDPKTRVSTAHISPDVRVMAYGAVDIGDTVTLAATVHNFSLVELTQPVPVEFWVGDPDFRSLGPRFRIIGLGGITRLNTRDTIPARDTAMVRMKWAVPDSVPSYARIYAVLDPDDTIDEIHEDNNKGYTILELKNPGVIVGAESPAEPRDFALLAGRPNPFAGTTRLLFELPRAARVSMAIFDVTGRKVVTLAQGSLPAGRHARIWDGRSDAGQRVPTGVYFCRMQADAFEATQRLMLLR